MNDRSVLELDCNRLVSAFHEKPVGRASVCWAKSVRMYAYLTSFILEDYRVVVAF